MTVYRFTIHYQGNEIGEFECRGIANRDRLLSAMGQAFSVRDGYIVRLWQGDRMLGEW